MSVATARLQFKAFRDDRANRKNFKPDELWFAPDLMERAWEINNALGKLDTANNNPNFHKGVYTLNEWDYINDANDWWMCDSGKRRKMVFWMDRIVKEFAFAEDLDTLVAKWRGYMRYTHAWTNWRWVLGNQVS